MCSSNPHYNQSVLWLQTLSVPLSTQWNIRLQHSAPRAAHTCCRMQGCIVHRGIKTVGREPSWCRVNSEYHKALAPFIIPCYGSKLITSAWKLAPCDPDRATSMVTAQTLNVPAVSCVRITTLLLRTCNLTTALSPVWVN